MPLSPTGEHATEGLTLVSAHRFIACQTFQLSIWHTVGTQSLFLNQTPSFSCRPETLTSGCTYVDLPTDCTACQGWASDRNPPTRFPTKPSVLYKSTSYLGFPSSGVGFMSPYSAHCLEFPSPFVLPVNPAYSQVPDSRPLHFIE